MHLSVLPILLLTFNIYWWLRPDSILWWRRTWFLWVSSVFLIYHLAILNSIVMSLRLSSVWNSTTHKIIMLLDKSKRIRWWSMMRLHHVFVISQSLSVGTRWSLLGCTRSETLVISLVWSNTSSSSRFVSLLRSVACRSHFSPTNHLTWTGLHTPTWVVVVHLIFEWGSPDWSSSFEDAKLLIEDLWICKSLMLCGLSKMRWTHYLLWHHQIVLLWSIYTLLALYWSHAITWRLDSRISHNLTNVAYTSYSSWHSILPWGKLFDCSWSIGIFTRNFWTISF